MATSSPAAGRASDDWHESADGAVRIAHRTWRHEFVPGQGSQDLPTTTHFAQASAVVTEDMVRQRIPCGPDPERHLAAVQAYADAGYDEVHILQMGPDQQGMLRFYQREILPNFQ